MRTRNRGQRTSIVSSLGLCPKNRKTKCLKKLIHKPHGSTRKLLGKRMKHVVETFTKRSTKRNMHKNDAHDQKPSTERMLLQLFSAQKSQKKYSTSVKLKLPNESSSSSPKIRKNLGSGKDSSCNSALSVETKEPSRVSVNAVTRGRKQFAKVGRPKLVKSKESTKELATKPSVALSRPRRSRVVPSEGHLPESKSTTNEETTPENSASNANITSTTKLPRASSRCLPSNIVQKSESDEPVIKRPRGRPRSSVTVKTISRQKFIDQQKKRSIRINPNPDTKLCENRSTYSQDLFDSSTSIISPKSIKIEDMYYANELKFGAVDSVLQDLLQEVNIRGVVPQASSFGNELLNRKTDDKENSDAVFTFDVPVVERVFNDLWQSVDKVLKLDAKDLFLALNGLLRPGICELWRRRLDEQSKKLSRSHMGRLRPNPRPRLYSDMFIPGGGGQPATVSRHPVSDVAHLAGKVRSGPRSVAIAAATKKLIRAKTHHKRSSRAIANATRNLTVTSFQVLTESEDVDPRSRRRSRKNVSGAQLSLPSRTRRRPDVSHHIDWKFCYAHSEKQKSTENTTAPKRRRKIELSSPDKPHVSLTVIPPDSDEVPSVDNSPSASYDAETPSVTTHEESVLPNANTSIDSDQTKREKADIADAHVMQINQSLADCIGIERSVEGRRKRRHALTVQRKRPVERNKSNFIDSERLLWRTEHMDKNDPLSDSSLTSVSLNNNPPSTYDRSFRHTKWIRPPMPKPKGNTEHVHKAASSVGSKPATRSVTLPRPRSMVGGLHSRRSGKNSQIYSYVSHRSRISRRPDRMCQLTLLDRLVLGLNCSVAQNDNEIHVKRLHEDELSILTQRINKTGFSVRSLSVRESANNDAEYNIVLTLSPNSDACVRRPRSNSLATRSHFCDLDHVSERSLRESSTVIEKQRLKSRPFSRGISDSRNSSRRSLIQSILEPVLRHPSSTHSLNSGYHSDTDLIIKKTRSRKLRRTRSDTDLLEPYLSTSEFSFVVGQRDPGSVSVHTHSGPFQPSEINGARHSPLVSNTPFQSSKDWSHPTSSQNRVTPSLGERRFLPEAVTQKRGIQLPRSGSERQTYDTDAHPIASVQPHSMTKRPLGVETIASSYMTPFRRHSPRKVIRKVYTGSSTIPKILNRKRPTGSPSINISIPSCSAPPTSSVLTSLTHSIPSSVNTSSCPNTLSTSTCTQSINSSSTPTIIFDEPTQALPVCPPTSVSGFSLQYRRFPSPVVPVTFLPTTAKLVDHSVNLNPASSNSTAYGENRSSGVLRFRTVSGISVGSSLTPVSVKTPDRINSSLAAKHPSTGSSLNNRDDSGSNLPIAESRGLNSKSFTENLTTATTTVASTSTVTNTTAASTEVKTSSVTTNTMVATTPPTNEPTITTASLMRSSELHPSRPSSVGHSVSSTTDLNNPASPESANCENELPADLDGSYTPATSMSASQLLKLKRLHDEAGRTGPGGPMHLTESRTNPPPPLYSTFPNRVQSPQTLPLQGKQPQSIHPESIDISRLGKSSQFESSSHECASPQELQQHQQQQQQQYHQQQQHSKCTPLSTHLQYASTVCSVSSTVIRSESPVTSTTIDPTSMAVTDEDADEFELKSVDQPAGGVFYSSVGGGITQSFQHREVNPPVGSPYSCAPTSSDLVRLSAMSVPRMQRLPWPSMRPNGPLSSSPFVAPALARFHSGVNVARATESGAVGALTDSLTSDQSTTRAGISPCLSTGTTVISSTSTAATCTPDSSAADHQQQRTLSCNPLSLPHAMTSGLMNAFDPSAQTLNLTTYNQSNSMSLSGVPLKRTIVHKYHSFRKILPKSPERLGQFVPTSGLHAMPSLSNASPGLTQLPVLGTTGSGSGSPGGTMRMYRAGATGSFSQPSLLSCDSTGETAYFVDISTNLADSSTGSATRTAGHSAPFGFHAYTTSTSTAGTMMNPASQLLKSLLEGGDSKETACTVFTVPIHQQHTMPHHPSSGLRKTTPNVSSSTGTVTWNQPAHQSRGTWQLGKRVQSTPSSSSSRPASEGSTPTRPSSTTEPRDASDTSGDRYPTSLSDLASSVKLTSGSSKSRLQQLQQHYQRRQQLQQAQCKQQQQQQQSPPSPLPADQSAQAQ